MAKRELSATLKSLKFMQRARQKEEVAKKEEEEEQKIISPIVGNKKCVVIMEGDPKPGALTGRMSFQNFNPSIDKLNEAIGDIHNQRASTTGTADRNGMDICRENETLQFGNDGSNKHRENEDLGQDLHRKKLRVEEDDQASYRSPKHAVTDNGNQLSADRGRKTKQEHSKLDWRHLRPPTGRTKRL